MADNKIATKKSVNVSGASKKSKVAVNRAAVSKADDKTGCSLGTSERREVTPAASYFQTAPQHKYDCWQKDGRSALAKIQSKFDHRWAA